MSGSVAIDRDCNRNRVEHIGIGGLERVLGAVLCTRYETPGSEHA